MIIAGHLTPAESHINLWTNPYRGWQKKGDERKQFIENCPNHFAIIGLNKNGYYYQQGNIILNHGY
jgi:hypothetical protein